MEKSDSPYPPVYSQMDSVPVPGSSRQTARGTFERSESGPLQESLFCPVVGGQVNAAHQDTACFVCGQLVRRAGWLENVLTQLACPECALRSRLASTNVRFSSLLGPTQTNPFPVEGRGLNAILNPVLIDQRRAWADFAFGGFAVFLERKPSADLFDFTIHHVDPWPRLLTTLREFVIRSDDPWVLLESITRRLAQEGDYGDPTSRLIRLWQLTRAGEAAVAVSGPLHCHAGVLVAAAALTPIDPSPSESAIVAMVAHLTSLANAVR